MGRTLFGINLLLIVQDAVFCVVGCNFHILRIHGHTFLEEQSAAAVYDEIGQRSLEGLFPGLTDDSMTQATFSASQSGIGFKRARDIAAWARLGALIAAEPRIHGTIRVAVLAGLLPEQLLETRLSEAIETATSTYLSALDNDEQATTARLYVQKAAQAADEAVATHCLGAARPRSRRPDHCILETSRLHLSG